MKICLLLLILFQIIYFFPFYFTDSVIAQRDLLFLNLPAKYEAVYQWRKGVIPFWAEKFSNGQPLLANPTSSSLYPLMFPLIIFPSLKTFTYLCLFHHLFFLLGAFFFANLILKNPYFSLFLSTFLGYNGIVIEFFSFCNPLWGIAYLPWSLFFFYKYLIDGEKIHLILTSTFFALSIFAGFDLAPFLFSFFLFLLTIYINHRKLLQLIFCLTLAFLFSAPQILPTLLYLPHTSRAEEQNIYEDSFGFYSLHPLRIIETFIPKFHGAVSEKFWADAISDKDTGLFISPYFGLVSILLLFSIRPFKKRWFFFSFVTIFLLLSFGRYFPLHYFLLKIPIFSNIRYPEKFLIFLLFFLYLYFIENFKEIKRISMIPSLVLSLLISILIFLNYASSGKLFRNYISNITYRELTNQPSLMQKYLFISLLISIFCIFIFYLSRKTKIIYPLISLICFADLFYACHHRIVPYSQSQIQSPFIRILKGQNTLRVMYIEENSEYKKEDIEVLSPNFGVLFGISYAFATSVDSMEPKYLIKEIKDYDFNMWGISHIISVGKRALNGVKVYKFSKCELWQINKNPTYIWFLNEKTKEAVPLPPILKIKNPSNIEIKVKNNENGILWLGISLLDGWNVYVDDIKTKIANKYSEGLNVFLKKGEHIVKFIYKPPGFYLGIFLFFVGLVLCVTIFLWKRKE